NTNLAAGAYMGTETLTTASGSVNVSVTLNIGSTGLVAAPISVTLSAAPGGAVAAQNVTITFNNAATNITSAVFTPSSGVNFLNQPSFTGNVATLTVSNTNLAVGSYTGSVTFTTALGPVNVPITLNIGTAGFTASPNPLPF